MADWLFIYHGSPREEEAEPVITANALRAWLSSNVRQKKDENQRLLVARYCASLDAKLVERFTLTQLSARLDGAFVHHRTGGCMGRTHGRYGLALARLSLARHRHLVHSEVVR